MEREAGDSSGDFREGLVFAAEVFRVLSPKVPNLRGWAAGPHFFKQLSRENDEKAQDFGGCTF